MARPAPFPACHGACEVTARSGQPHLTPLRSAPASAAPGPATPEAGRRPEKHRSSTARAVRSSCRARPCGRSRQVSRGTRTAAPRAPGQQARCAGQQWLTTHAARPSSRCARPAPSALKNVGRPAHASRMHPCRRSPLVMSLGPLRRPPHGLPAFQWPHRCADGPNAVGARPALRSGHAPPRPPPAHSARCPARGARSPALVRVSRPSPVSVLGVPCLRPAVSLWAGPWAGWSWRAAVQPAPPKNRGRCPHPPLSRGARGLGIKGHPQPSSKRIFLARRQGFAPPAPGRKPALDAGTKSGSPPRITGTAFAHGR